MKRFAALLLAALLCAAALTGCKIEFPDDVAVIPPLSSTGSADVSAPSASSAIPAETTAATTAATGTTTVSPPAGSTAASTAKPTAATTKDKYQTDPVPEGKPQPVNPEDTEVNRKKTGTCTLSVDCLTILDNKDKLKKEKLSVLPADGIVYKERTVLFYEGESVYDVLNREMKKYRIHMASRNTPCLQQPVHRGHPEPVRIRLRRPVRLDVSGQRVVPQLRLQPVHGQAGGRH